MRSDSQEKRFFEMLYQKYERLIYRTARRMTSDPDAADDIAQDSMLRILLHYDTLSKLEPKALKAYIARTVQSAAINHWRQDTRFYEAERSYPREPLIGSAEDVMMASLDPGETFSWWSELSPGEQRILVLRYYCGLSTGQIAELYRCSDEAVRGRLFRARKHVLALIQKRQHTDSEGNGHEFK